MPDRVSRRTHKIGWRLKDSMIDSPGPTARRKAVPGAADEETRLRQQAIGVKLRHMFDEVVNEPIPDEFIEILRRADARTSNGQGED